VGDKVLHEQRPGLGVLPLIQQGQNLVGFAVVHHHSPMEKAFLSMLFVQKTYRCSQEGNPSPSAGGVSPAAYQMAA
jgi:hypothetical protein